MPCWFVISLPFVMIERLMRFFPPAYRSDKAAIKQARKVPENQLQQAILNHWTFLCMRINCKNLLTRWVPHDGYIRHRKCCVSGQWRIYPSCPYVYFAVWLGRRPPGVGVEECFRSWFALELSSYGRSFESYVCPTLWLGFPRFFHFSRGNGRVWFWS